MFMSEMKIVLVDSQVVCGCRFGLRFRFFLNSFFSSQASITPRNLAKARAAFFKLAHNNARKLSHHVGNTCFDRFLASNATAGLGSLRSAFRRVTIKDLVRKVVRKSRKSRKSKKGCCGLKTRVTQANYNPFNVTRVPVNSEISLVSAVSTVDNSRAVSLFLSTPTAKRVVKGGAAWVFDPDFVHTQGRIYAQLFSAKREDKSRALILASNQTVKKACVKRGGRC